MELESDVLSFFLYFNRSSSSLNFPHLARPLESICMTYNHGVVCFIRFAVCRDFCDERHRSPRNLIPHQNQNTRRARRIKGLSV